MEQWSWAAASWLQWSGFNTDPQCCLYVNKWIKIKFKPVTKDYRAPLGSLPVTVSDPALSVHERSEGDYNLDIFSALRIWKLTLLRINCDISSLWVVFARLEIELSTLPLCVRHDFHTTYPEDEYQFPFWSMARELGSNSSRGHQCPALWDNWILPVQLCTGTLVISNIFIFMVILNYSLRSSPSPNLTPVLLRPRPFMQGLIFIPTPPRLSLPKQLHALWQFPFPIPSSFLYAFPSSPIHPPTPSLIFLT